MSGYEAKRLSEITDPVPELRGVDLLYAILSGKTLPVSIDELATYISRVTHSLETATAALNEGVPIITLTFLDGNSATISLDGVVDPAGSSAAIAQQLNSLNASINAAISQCQNYAQATANDRSQTGTDVATAGAYSASAADALLQMDGWTGIRQFKSAEGFRGYTSISTPSSRYTDTVSTPDVYGFKLDQTQASVLITGRTFNSAIAAGQSLEVYAALSGTGFTSASGLVLGFMPTLPTDFTALPAGFVGYAWRSGSLTAYGPDGTTSVPANAPGAGTIPTFTSGDSLRMRITRDATGAGGTITLAVNGGTETVISVTTLPASAYLLFVGARQSPGADNTATAQLSSFRTIRQTISSTTKLPVTSTPLVFRGNYNPNYVYNQRDSVVGADGRNYECISPCGGIAPLTQGWQSYWRVRADIWPPVALPTFQQRVAPTGFSNYPFALSAYYDGTPQTATLKESVMDTFARIYSARMTASAVYVDSGPLGSDSKPGTSSAPLKTLQAAMAKNPSVVYVAPGTYDPFSYRADTHSAVVGQLAGGVVKWLRVWDRDTDTSKRVTIAVTAPDTIAAKSWMATAGHADVWQATLTYSGSNAPHRILDNSVRDAYGFPSRLKKATSLANLDTLSAGWYWTAGTLYIKVAAGVSVDAYKSNLEALWLDTAGNSRIFIYGTVLAIDGDFYLKGVDRTPLQYATTPSRAESWVRGVTSFATAGNSCRVDGGWVVSENERGHASNGDQLNGNPSGTFGGLIVHHRCYLTDAGDLQGFQLTPTVNANCNAISAHGGCDHIGVGTFGEGSYGPVIADTSTAGVPALTWLIGCCGIGSRASLETGNGGIGFLIQGLPSAVDTGNRKAWLDGCVASGNSLYGAMQSTNGTMQQVGCSFGTQGGLIPTYSVSAP